MADDETGMGGDRGGVGQYGAFGNYGSNEGGDIHIVYFCNHRLLDQNSRVNQ